MALGKVSTSKVVELVVDQLFSGNMEGDHVSIVTSANTGIEKTAQELAYLGGV